jgi:hypothetical protein
MGLDSFMPVPGKILLRQALQFVENPVFLVEIRSHVIEIFHSIQIAEDRVQRVVFRSQDEVIRPSEGHWIHLVVFTELKIFET